MSNAAPSILFHNGFVHSSADAFATAVYIEDGVIAWLGDEVSASSYKKLANKVIDLKGALVAPAFVDAHVHLIGVGMAATSVDLSPVNGATSVASTLEIIAQHLEGNQVQGNVITSVGFDDSAWGDQTLTTLDLDERFPNLAIYVPRVDMHSAVCSTELLNQAGIENSNDRVAGETHAKVRSIVENISSSVRTETYKNALKFAASQGVVALHENSAPGIDTRAGLAELISLTESAQSLLPLVVGYRGELVSNETQLQELLQEIPGLSGLAGDLSVDGSFGSRSAALREDYSDSDNNKGTLHFTQQEIENHIRTCSEANITAGFHVIGDKAIDTVLAAAQKVADEPGMLSKMRRSGHRLEHVELIDTQNIELLAKFGFMVSAQPSFDAHWGGPGGMYETRIGKERTQSTNPYSKFLKAGVPLAFGSDAPVTNIDPWGAVAAAVFHHNPEHRISARAAFKAHTRGGWRIAGEANPLVGEIRIGAPAHLALWQCDELGVQAENAGRSSWSTDARAGSPLLPILAPAQADTLKSESTESGAEMSVPELSEAEMSGVVGKPQCLATLREGQFIYTRQDALDI